MDYEILKKNNPNNEEYFLKILLRDLKNLDSSLTKFLVQDFYREEQVTKKDVMDDIAKISNICKYILSALNYDENYYEDFMDSKVKESIDIYNSWISLCKIKQLLESYVDMLGIKIFFNLGFSFECCCNFASLEIMYKEKINDYSTHTFTILTIVTHEGKSFQIHKTRKFYEKSTFPIEEYRQNINTSFIFDDIDKVVAKVSDLCLDFKENLLKEKENAEDKR